jgi:chorismate-pyruvate lyase
MSPERPAASSPPYSVPGTPHPIFPLVVIDSVLWPADSTVTFIPAADMPEPYRGLLAHTHHMTVTVEAFYGSPVDVRVLESGRTGDDYHRRIVLTPHGTDRIVQYGLVRINLGLLDPAVSQEVVGQKTPLGRILIQHNVLRRVEPTAFLRVDPGPTLCRQMALTRPVPLYGRTGVIFCNDQPAIAVLELLSPV